jgi:hypothetical protein
MEGNVEAARIILESHPDIEKADVSIRFYHLRGYSEC